MATQTIVFPGPADQTIAAVRIVKITDDSVVKTADSVAQRANAKGIYEELEKGQQ